MGENIVGAVLARNEAGRYLKRVIENLQESCDEILVVDDHSTDDTAKVARHTGASVISLPTQSPMWGQETLARSFLWEQASKRAGDGWIYFADADHITVGDLRPLAKSWVVNAWAFPLFDVWDEDGTVFRADGPWGGYQYPRVWMVAPSRVPQGWSPQWQGRGMHSGHIPMNFPLVAACAPGDFYIKHMGWAKEADRIEKVTRYREQFHQMSDFEKAHVESVLD